MKLLSFRFNLLNGLHHVPSGAFCLIVEDFPRQTPPPYYLWYLGVEWIYALVRIHHLIPLCRILHTTFDVIIIRKRHRMVTIDIDCHCKCWYRYRFIVVLHPIFKITSRIITIPGEKWETISITSTHFISRNQFIDGRIQCFTQCWPGTV